MHEAPETTLPDMSPTSAPPDLNAEFPGPRIAEPTAADPRAARAQVRKQRPATAPVVGGPGRCRAPEAEHVEALAQRQHETGRLEAGEGLPVVAEVSLSQVPPHPVVVPLGRATSGRVVASPGQRRHDNPHWPVRSPDDAADALHLHGDCAWHCATKVAAIRVSADDFRYFRDRTGGEPW